MKHYRKHQSPRFKKRNSFSSPECSTVVQVNPSCESEQSMLQKIIFPDHLPPKNDYQTNRYPKQPLQQKSINTININREIGKLNKNLNYFDENAYGKETRNQYSEYLSKQNRQNLSNRFQSYKRSSQQKYETYKPTDTYSRQKIHSLSSNHSLSNLIQRTSSKKDSRLQSYQSNEFKKNYSTQKYKNQYCYNDQIETVIDEVKLRQIQQKIMRYREKNRKTNPSGSKQIHKQTKKTVSFRDTMENQLNKIQIQFMPSNQSKLKKKQTIIDNISLLDKEYPSFTTPSSKGNQVMTRVPGKLLSQNKGSCRKDSQSVQSTMFQLNKNQNVYPSFTSSNQFRRFNDVQNQIQISKIHDILIQKRTQKERITKKAYMQPTQITENDEKYQPRIRESYETQIDMNQKALQLMLAQEKVKQYVPLKYDKETKRQLNDDDELERLNNLQKKFNLHFNSRK